MLPAWSENLTPVVFINLIYGSLRLLFQKPVVCSQGADISLRTTSTIFFPSLKAWSLVSCSANPFVLAGGSSSTNRPRTLVCWKASMAALTLLPAVSTDTGAMPCCCARPLSGSSRNRRTSAWTCGYRKLPWMVDTPLGGCAGMMSMPTMRPFGLVRSTATYNREGWPT